MGDARRNGGIGCAAAVLAVLGLAACGGGHESPAPVEKLPPADVAKCRGLLEAAEKAGIIRDRPAANRIDVEDSTWAALPSDVKDVTLQAVACEVWQARVPPAGEHAVAYGYRSGKRVEMLTSVGFSRD